MSQRRPPRTPAEEERHQRRLDALETLQHAAELRERMHPRQRHLARARALLHARTTRG